MATLTRARTRTRPSPALLVAIALGIVYVVWGSTYLAIRVAVETMPPFLMAAVRFLLAGAVLYAWAARRGDRAGDPIGAPQWKAAFIVGGLLLLGGNGLVSWGEQTVPSGIAALLVAGVALWMALMGRIAYGERLRWPAVVGLAIGFLGVAVLVGPSGAGGFDPAGVAAIVLATVCWAAGSLYSRRAALPQRPLVATAMEMLAGGVLLTIVGIVTGELGRLDVAAISLRSALAVVYLIVFGSLVAFSAYVWLLRHARTSLVATYAYVNPVVAVLLGWLLLAEPVTARTLLAGGIIIAGVALIVGTRAPAAPAPDPELEPVNA